MRKSKISRRKFAKLSGAAALAIAGNGYWLPRALAELAAPAPLDEFSYGEVTITSPLHQAQLTNTHLTLASHPPPSWNTITLSNLRVGASRITASITSSATELMLEMQNDGPSIETAFRPEIPLGAKLERTSAVAMISVKAVFATLEQNAQDSHAHLEFTLPHGKTRLKLEYSGGVAIIQNNFAALIGEPSKALKITGARLSGGVYTLDFDYPSAEVNTFDIRTPWQILDVRGATFVSSSRDLYRFSLGAPAEDKSGNGYRHGQVTITFSTIADGFRAAP